MDKIFKEVSVKKLYKDCMFLAKYFGRRQGNEAVLMGQVRQQFKANMHELDDDKIREQKEAAIRALHNMHLLEADRYVRDKKT
ncbi:hypothetical protein CHLRE_14g626250v5 [Chlamydomonas reinhardtii]|uniref:Uncharacterized protein n=1 Tax=Chlamydomonas reinhardtii TaxID=3055 RepID=A8IV50_CHLRE|nr:uncharacterized protein CHLRE_14g626250v5 [Chlamydomonas reinhardtii]PNW73281.1 hypothetical protein CHLRE_14g626250v5 [Chlamydomonas reinhardtii]|eukprot:XP_001692706.1 predicted protein [Chlamydomonas reinhardtii]